ncbi:H(+)/Cl(-) exchange transporter ClcA [Methylocystis bryophila]|uniref:Chloride channel protein n=1 Tax=Methylocystis bryophila TaxID=655015 RepID=A0A1W6MUW0_9HYPH|nr:H(+)/Cl(-) exchange transporter ClcA [Methylocystis bryophila]ARN81357.1 chloride channel protein [Methylocystis bryophila]
MAALSLASLFVGAGVGLVAASFRLFLDKADHFRNVIVEWAHQYAAGGFALIIVLCATATWIAAWLVRRFAPNAAGSGIPHVENVLNRKASPAPAALLLVKYFGGLLAIGSGQALGREGPSVQMGATIGHLCGGGFGLSWRTRRVLLAAGAGAGLAAAFNAPVAGAVFVLEELVRQFELHIAIAALGASATAIWVCQAILGPAPDFHVEELAFADPETYPLYFLSGAIAGVAGILYCKALLGAMSLAERIDRGAPGLTALLMGALVGALAWFFPALVGGGDPITQNALLGPQPLLALCLVFLLRFGFAVGSYATTAPGGIFAPLLTLGAQLGLLCGEIAKLSFPAFYVQPVGFALVGMAALFTAVVRAPLTGIVLITEMTSDATLLLPMLGASFCAMIAPTLARQAPIYDSLRERALPPRGAQKKPGAGSPIDAGGRPAPAQPRPEHRPRDRSV